MAIFFFLPTLTGEGDLTNFQWSESIQIWYAASLHHSLGLFLDLVENIEFFSTFDIFWKLIWDLDILRIWCTWWRRFHQLPLIGIKPNLVCSFLTSFPRTIFGFIPKYLIFLNFWHFLKLIWDLDILRIWCTSLVKAISSTSIGWNQNKFGIQLPYCIP